jgi:hypothetical protein
MHGRGVATKAATAITIKPVAPSAMDIALPITSIANPIENATAAHPRRSCEWFARASQGRVQRRVLYCEYRFHLIEEPLLLPRQRHQTSFICSAKICRDVLPVVWGAEPYGL